MKNKVFNSETLNANICKKIEKDVFCLKLARNFELLFLFYIIEYANTSLNNFCVLKKTISDFTDFKSHKNQNELDFSCVDITLKY
jgi:hypothetical protein